MNNDTELTPSTVLVFIPIFISHTPTHTHLQRDTSTLYRLGQG